MASDYLFNIENKQISSGPPGSIFTILILIILQSYCTQHGGSDFLQTGLHVCLPFLNAILHFFYFEGFPFFK